MNRNYFFVFFISILFHCYSLWALSCPSPATNYNPNDAECARVTDTVESIKKEICTGKDSTFFKGQSASIGIAKCTTINKEVGGIIISIGYTSNKQGDKTLPVAANLRLTSRRPLSGQDPIKMLSYGCETKGTKIAFSIGAIDTISWNGKPWGAPTTIYGTYDTSNGEYSVQINQETPVVR